MKEQVQSLGRIFAPVAVEIQPFRGVWAAITELGNGEYSIQSLNGGYCLGSCEAMRLLTFSQRGESSYVLAPSEILAEKATLIKKFDEGLKRWARNPLVESQRAYLPHARQALQREKIWSVGMILGKTWDQNNTFCIFYPNSFTNLEVVPLVMRSPVLLTLYLLKQFRAEHDSPIPVNSLKGLPLI